MEGLDGVRPTFRALATTIVPEASRLTAAEWAEVERIVAEALGKRPAAVRRQLLAFIRLLNLLPLFRYGRTFRGLDDDRRGRFLRGIQDARPLLFRRGFWGIRTLVFMGYYARPAARAQVGYGARPRGWLEHPMAPPASRAAAAAEAGEAGGPAGGARG